MVTREMSQYLLSSARSYPVVTILGPRQSGKTTLAKSCFPDKPYANLENPVTRSLAEEDPVAFLKQFPDGAVLDEIQRVPSILSFIQVIVDEQDREGLFVLTGSHQFDLRASINQSLAGRTAILRLLPFSMSECSSYGKLSANQMIYRGFYPRVHEKQINPSQAYSDYLETYIERDLRQLIAIRDLSQFHKFMRLLAGRTGQLLNMANLATDVGVSLNTVKEWISILETSFVIFLLQPWQANLRKRLVKTPKIYFYDVGLAALLIGIEQENQIATHPLRGNLYENMIIADVVKYRFNRGLRNELLFYRDSTGNEVDLLYPLSDSSIPIEIKSGQTISSDYFKGVRFFESNYGPLPKGSIVVYNGDTEQKREKEWVVNELNLVKTLDSILETI